jgi:hypothetical protein
LAGADEASALHESGLPLRGLIAVVIVLVPVVLLVPAALVLVPPAVMFAPAAFAGFMQFAALVVGLAAVPSVMLDGFVQLVFRMLDAALATLL